MKYSIVIMAALLIGCAPDADTSMRKASPKGDSTIEVTRVGVIEDDLAYGSRRGIYRIKDRDTGKEYVGISGIGISEVGSHNCGKNCNRSDER